MGVTRIRQAMNAGKRWAEKQQKDGIEIDPSSAEQAAQEKYSHAGFQHLFITSALEVLLDIETQAPQQAQAEPR
ncbi:hypothetical protein HNQ77_002266 [Silvibacterium bohemicum]|uniref:Uncharacterized protein n=1 Tax=Silvibacterium bohemicum TaxID=1577686 RepID=A0A841K242_9BACT|nr:hypothetical protein [Silvibacterium bohemicum]MBB6144314.1 hypothetical protein [Silvibacterium bohemicum]